MQTILDETVRLLEAGIPAVSAAVLRKTGSAPRGAGARMLVFPDGTTAGTIGGGLVEKECTDLGVERHAETGGGPRIHAFGLSAAEAASLDMICGGKVDVLLERIEPTPEAVAIFRTMSETLRRGERCTLCTALDGDGTLPPRFMLLGGEVIWEGKPVNGQAHADAAALVTASRPHVAEVAGQSYFVEPCLASGTLFLFGAGHVSRCTAALASTVGFRTVIIDDRSDFANRERFPLADEIQVIESFENCMEGLATGPDAFLVIVTRGHMSDNIVLEAALRTNAAYVGMIGSRSKRKALYASLEQHGFTQEDIGRIHSPIGLTIGAETPEEIAVSIVAELIQCRAENGRS